MNIVGQIYFLLLLHIYVHELCHVLVAVSAKIPIVKASFGAEGWGIDICQYTFSIIPLGGYVEVDLEYLMRQHKIVIIAFFEAGVIGNILVTALSYMAAAGVMRIICFIIGIILVLSNQMPFMKTDMKQMIYVLRKSQ